LPERHEFALGDPLHAHVVLSFMKEVCTEGERPLAEVGFSTSPSAWRLVREDGDTKTEKSLEITDDVATAPKEHRTV
jgi:hypothetical protein